MPETILCIDDDVSVLSTMTLVLRSFGYCVFSASTLTEAWRICLEAQQIDVALVDESVCREAGTCLFSRLRSLQPNMVGVIHTGNPEINPNCIDTRPVIFKPTDPEKLICKIEELLRRAKPAS